LNHPVAGATPIALGAWHQAAATYDGTTWKLYLDGVLEATLVVGQPVRSNSIQPAALATCSACAAVPPTTPRQASGWPGEVGPSSGVAVASSTAHVAPNATAAKSTATAAPRAVCRRATGRPEPRVAGRIAPNGATIWSI